MHCGHSVGLSAHPRKIEPEQVAVICVYDAAGNVIQTHEHRGDYNSALRSQSPSHDIKVSSEEVEENKYLPDRASTVLVEIRKNF